MPMMTEGRKHTPRCDCCGERGRTADSEWRAARWAHIGKWDTPGRTVDGDPYEGYFRCPACVAAGRWPLECDGWQFADMNGPQWRLTDGPVIRLADGDEAADVGLDAMPDALVG